MNAVLDGPEVRYEQLMARWGYCVDGEITTIEFLLRILREQSGDSRVSQRCRFGMSESDFRRLQRMARPRSDHFVEDLWQTAMACNIPNFKSFLGTTQQARQLVEG